jgi:SAM-dependent methyltransferase
VFGAMSWLELPPAVWFGLAFIASLPLLRSVDPVSTQTPSVAGVAANLVLLGATLVIVHVMARGAIWSPYYKITVGQEGPDTVVEVNNIFHQSMAPVDHKEYFYQWPYAVFGDTFQNVLVLGAGSGTDVAAALKHGAAHVDAVEIDPVIMRLGLAYHPDRPYSDPRVTRINDDARHYLRTTDKKYDLVVFALIDSLTMQSSFSGVRLESYMFTEQSFRAVRDRLNPNGLLVVYNYFREPWLVDRLANIAANAFNAEPRVHVHEARAYLGVMLAGPRLTTLTTDPVVPDRVTAFNQSHEPSPARLHRRERSIEPATDNWPFLYLRDRHIPAHYIGALALILVVSTVAVMATLRGQAGRWSWEMFLLGAAFMLLETKSIIQFALLWGSTWFVASLVIAAVLTMAILATVVVSRVTIRRPWMICAVLVTLLAVNYLLPVGAIGFPSRAVESLFYALLVFSPIFCAGLLFGSAIKRSTSLSRDYGTNLLGAMVGGVGEYLSLVTGFSALLGVIALCYIAAVAVRRR